MTRSTSTRSFAGIATTLCCLSIMPTVANAQTDHQWVRNFGGSLHDLTYSQDGKLHATELMEDALVLTEDGDTMRMNVYANHDIIQNYYAHDGHILWSEADQGDAFSPDKERNVYATADAVQDETICEVQGGTLVAPANRSFCVGTGQPFGIFINAVGSSGSFRRWALINANGDFVATRSVNSLFNLDIYPPGNYTIRYLRHEANVTNFSAVNKVSQIGLLNGCYSLSSNAIGIFLRSTPDGGVLSANGPTQVCAGQGAQTSVSVSVSGNTGQNNVYALLSLPAQTLLASNTVGTFNLNNLPNGNYAAAHLSFQQGVKVEGVSNPSQLQGCYALSNLVQVSLENCAQVNLQAYPNPAQAVSRISFSSPSSGHATLEVYDMNGRRIAGLYADVMHSDEMYTRDFQAEGLPSGVYIIRLTLQDEVVVHRLILGS